jgi:hypothetical protein
MLDEEMVDDEGSREVDAVASLCGTLVCVAPRRVEQELIWEG